MQAKTLLVHTTSQKITIVILQIYILYVRTEKKKRGNNERKLTGRLCILLPDVDGVYRLTATQENRTCYVNILHRQEEIVHSCTCFTYLIHSLDC